MNLPRITLAILLQFLVWQTQAGVLVEDFSSVTQKETSTAVWNFVSGVIHPTLQVTNYQAPAQLAASADFSVGDGHHGPFNPSTYANFGTVVGSTITIDASVYDKLEFSSFHLANTYTLTSINGPLVIYSLSDVLIDGTIECSGLPGGSAIGITGGVSGLGRCGGRNGGVGGNFQASGTQGLPTAGTVTGGLGANYVGVAPGAGGGGGGAYAGNPGSNGQNSVPATNTLGAGGNGVAGANHEFTILNGSPGGGGGSGSNTEGGGGGGGGGGTVVIHAVGDVTISATGLILARGGAGGSANTGGGGGGGGGGSVKIFTPGQLTLDSGTPVDVSGGSGAVPTLANAGDGGAGSFGRTWDISSTFAGTGSESHASGLVLMGTVEYVTAQQEAISKTYDTSSTLTTFQSLTANPNSAAVSLQVAGSSDNFASDDSGWIPASQIAQLDRKRYVKFKILLTNTNPATPDLVDSLNLNFDSGIKNEFEFKSGGCGIIKNSPPQGPGGMTLFLLTSLLLLPIMFALRLKTIKA